MGDDEAFFAQMDECAVLDECYRLAKPVKELRGATPRPTAAICNDFKVEGLRDLLLEEDNTLQHLIIDKAGTRGYHQAQGFLEAAVSNVSSLQLQNDDLDEEKICSFDDAIAAAKHKGMPIKLKTLSLVSCTVDVGALARSEHLPTCLERLEFTGCSRCTFSPGLKELLQDPACNIWELCLRSGASDVIEKEKALFQPGTSLRKLTLDSHLDDSSLVQRICSTVEGLEILVLDTEDVSLLAAGIKNNDKFRFLRVGIGTVRLIKPLGQLLQSPYCKLQGFSIHKWPGPSVIAEVQDVILSSLEANYSSRIQRLDVCGEWASKVLKERWLRVKYRNAIFSKNPILTKKAPVRPPTPLLVRRTAASTTTLSTTALSTTTKLFMCGHTGSGKTTISTNLVRPYAALWKYVKPPFQGHASSVGIERRILNFGKKNKLLIYDLGGQEVYHAFHHYFIRGSDKYIFLVVCRVPSPRGDLKTELQYWLRFIVAHQSAIAARKPTVFLMLNISDNNNSSLEVLEAQATAEEMSTKYKDKLNFQGANEKDMFFEVNGKDAHQVQEVLKPKLKKAVDEMLKDVSVHIPWSCDEVIRMRAASTRAWYDIRTQAQPMMQERVLQLHEMSKTLFKKEQEESEQAINDAAKYTLTCLHDMGEAVYFGADDAYRDRDPSDQEAALLVNNAVLDMPWFLKQVLGVFLPQQDRNDKVKWGKPKQSICLAIRQLQAVGEIEEANIYFLLKLLCEMGVLIPDVVGTNMQIRWSEPRNLPEYVIVPALLDDKFAGWTVTTDNQQNYYCWGRRLQPDDTMKDFVLLPSGIFAVIQTKVKQMCEKWRHGIWLGAGWVSFLEDKIEVLVTVGGDSMDWTDRQWVDIMLMVPKEEKRGLKGDKFVNKIRNCVLKETNRACPSIKLEDYVLNPSQVSKFGEASVTHIGAESSWALQEVKRMVTSEGFDYSFTWGLGHKDYTGWDLLMPSEANKIINSYKQALEEVVTEYKEHIVPLYQEEEQQQQHEKVQIPNFDNKDMTELAKLMVDLHKQQEKSMNSYMEEIKVSMKNLQESLKKTESALIKSCSSLLGSMEVKCPKLPHITLESNPVLRYLPLVGKKVNIHYLCEHPGDYHTVDLKEYQGVQITVPHEWFKDYGNVFVPAMTVCFALLKLGKLALPVGGEVAGTLIDLGQKGLKTAIDSCSTVDLRQKKLEPTALEDLFSDVTKNAAEEYRTTPNLMMRKCFGLYKSQSGSGWVCKNHRYGSS